MKYVDYRCNACGTLRTAYFEDLAAFPSTMPCEACGVPCRRSYAPQAVIMHQGRAGNSKNGFTSSPVSIKKT